MHEEADREFDARLARFPALEPGPELALARHELEDLVRRHLEELPDKYRLPLVYTAIDGLDYATVATMLGHPGWVAATVSLAWAGYVSRSLFSRI